MSQPADERTGEAARDRDAVERHFAYDPPERWAAGHVPVGRPAPTVTARP